MGWRIVFWAVIIWDVFWVETLPPFSEIMGPLGNSIRFSRLNILNIIECLTFYSLFGKKTDVVLWQWWTEKQEKRVSLSLL
jgi:hypothetical protein